MPYATDLQRKLAVELGYTVEENTKTGTSFGRRTRRVWSVVSMTSGDPSEAGLWFRWQTADVINGSFTGHKKFDTLEDALRREAYYVVGEL